MDAPLAATRVDTLLEIACAINGELDLQRLFWVIYEQCSRVFDTRNFLLATCDPDGANPCVQVWFYRGRQLQQGDLRNTSLGGLSPVVIRNRSPLIVTDYVAALADRDLPLPPPTDPTERLAWLGVPIRVGERLIGVVTTSRPGPPYSAEDVRLLEAIAAQCAVAIENARLVEVVTETVRELVRRTQELAGLNAVATAVNRAFDLKTVIQQAADSLWHVTGWDTITIRLWNPATRSWDLGARRGVPLALTSGPEDAASGTPRDAMYAHTTPALLAGRPVSVELTTAPDLAHYHAAGLLHLIGLPVQTRGQVVGAVMLGATRADTAKRAAALLVDTTLAAICEQLAVAVENARLHSRAQQAAALEERHRLARELHDSVTQSLFTVTLMAEAAVAQLARDPDRVAATLDRLQTTAHTALADLRALLGQLRPQGLGTSGLGAALRKHAETVSAQVGLPIAVEVDPALPALAPAVEEALFRIAQEALHNVVKHAAASQATICLTAPCPTSGAPPPTVTLTIADDGRGVLPGLPPEGSFGLTSMSERAHALGGSFAVTPVWPHGTCVTVVIPLT